MRKLTRTFLTVVLAGGLIAALGCIGCGSSDDAGSGSRSGNSGGSSGRSGSSGGPGGGPGGGQNAPTAVPVEVETAVRTTISSYIQANGTLEAENEVDVVARTSGPLEALRTEEGQRVGKGQLLARIDDDDVRSQVEISRVALEEARLNYERAERLYGQQLLSSEEYEQIKTRFDTARAQHDGNQLLLGYTEIRAPFAGRIVRRYVDVAEQVSPGTPLFRISDFDPLLCPVQVPERELPSLALGQSAYLNVEAWPEERFEATVLRISPVVDAGTGTVKVTLDVDARDRLRPGMFARVFLEIDTHENAVVIPKKALSLESLGDTVFVHDAGVARRRDVDVGFEEGDSVEILSGVEAGDEIVVVGQDGLSEGTPIQVLGPATAVAAGGDAPAQSSTVGAPGSARSGDPGGPAGLGARTGAGMPDVSQMTPEQIEQLKERMRSRGLTEEQIEQRLARMRERANASQQ